MRNLRFLRKQRNLTQENLAEMIGIEARRISAYENGRAETDLATLTMIADFFGVSIDYLVGHNSDIMTAK